MYKIYFCTYYRLSCYKTRVWHPPSLPLLDGEGKGFQGVVVLAKGRAGGGSKQLGEGTETFRDTFKAFVLYIKTLFEDGQTVFI